jgi:hypothetical protein
MPRKTAAAPRKKAKAEQASGSKAGQRQIGATELPRKTLEECLTVAKPVYEVYAGKSASWDEIATTAGIGTKTNNTKSAGSGSLDSRSHEVSRFTAVERYPRLVRGLYKAERASGG